MHRAVLILTLTLTCTLGGCNGPWVGGGTTELEQQQAEIQMEQGLVAGVLEQARAILADARAHLGTTTDPEDAAETEAIIARVEGVVQRAEERWGTLAAQLEATATAIAAADSPEAVVGAAGSGAQTVAPSLPPPWNIVLYALGTVAVAFGAHRRAKRGGEQLATGIIESIDAARQRVETVTDQGGVIREQLILDLEAIKRAQRELGIKKDVDRLRDGAVAG